MIREGEQGRSKGITERAEAIVGAGRNTKGP